MIEDREDRLYDGDIPTGIVIDNGTSTCRIGLAGDDAPNDIISNVVGRKKYKNLCVQSCDTFIGNEAQQNREILDLSYPMQRGMVTNWDDMEKVWRNCYNCINVMAENHPVLLTEVPGNPHRNREKMKEVMFESLSVPAMYVQIDGVLSVYASGRNTALTISIGDGICHVLPVTEGYTIQKSILRHNLAGRDLTESLLSMLNEQGIYLNKTNIEVVQDLKERLCYVAADFTRELQKSREYSVLEKTYVLPDKSVITIGSERFRVPEALFNPKLIAIEGYGIHELVNQSLLNADIDLRKHLAGNLVLAGGSTLFHNIGNRLHDEVNKLVPAPVKVKVIESPDRKHSAWIGGSILASLSTFQNYWITKAMYDENGPGLRYDELS